MAASLAVLGAHIRTMDPEQPFASAVSIENGMITAVGDDQSVRAVCDHRTELIDGKHLCIVPGLTDSHFHPFWGTRATRGVDLTAVTTLVQLRSALASERQRVGTDAWVMGWGLTFEMFQQTGIRGDTFADAVGGGLAYLAFFDGHTAVVSPAAIAYADVTGRERFEDFSTVVVDEHGAPTGELQEMGAQRLILDLVPQPTEDQLYRWYVENFKKWNAVGLTGLHVMLGKPETLDLVERLEANGDLSLRMVVPLWQEPNVTIDEMRELLSMRDRRGRRWRSGTAKFFMDGVIESGTAWLLEPDTKGAGTEPFWPDPAKYTAAVDLFAKAGFQVTTHAVGDAAVRHALDAYQAAGAAPGVRHRIEHIELLDDQDLPRFAELGVVASMQPLHMNAYEADGSDEWSVRVGPERRERAFRTRELRDSGAIVALGSDWMVATYDPGSGMAWAHLRRVPGKPERGCIQPEHALSMLEVLEGYTSEAARTVSEEHISGRIKTGYRGDLSAFAEDVVTANPDSLPELPCLLTVVDGAVVHRADL